MQDNLNEDNYGAMESTSPPDSHVNNVEGVLPEASDSDWAAERDYAQTVDLAPEYNHASTAGQSAVHDYALAADLEAGHDHAPTADSKSEHNDTLAANLESEHDHVPTATPETMHDHAPVTDIEDTHEQSGAVTMRHVFPNLAYDHTSVPPPPPEAVTWREPAYSQAQEHSANVYTPGICVDHPLMYKTASDARGNIHSRTKSRRFGRFIRVVCLVLACAICSGAATYGIIEYRFRRGDFTINNQVVLGASQGSSQGNAITPISTGGMGMLGEDIYEMALSQVVGINTEIESSGGILGAQGASTVVSGSGFIISSDGYILTNYHVIETANQGSLPLMVYLSNGSQYEATVIGYDSSNDFAVIKIDATGLSPAYIGDSDNIKVGQQVYAVGNPFGDLVNTMTLGIISALDRVVTIERKSICTFQFDAAVNSGNSGGPVYNTNGEVIGIVTAKLMSDSVEGIGFAIPINDAIEIASELIEHGYITGRPLLGVTAGSWVRGYSDFFETFNGDELVTGAFVSQVNAGSAAEKAGIQVGDIIIKLNDDDITSLDSLQFTLRKYKAGDTAQITIWRFIDDEKNGEVLTLSITFDENLSAGQPQQPSPQEPQPSARPPR